MKKYDYLIVGAGLYGAIVAYRARKAGKSVLVIEKREHIGGNLYCEPMTDPEGEDGDVIHVHRYGPHIFHTSNKEVWDFVNSLVPFNHFRYCPLASYEDKLYHLPFNMNTFYELWGTKTPEEARNRLAQERSYVDGNVPQNLEEQAISLVGNEIYQKLIKGYTEKQWGRDCKDLPAFIIRRLPVRYYYDNNYFNDCYQGIPIGGYNKLFDVLLEGVEVSTGIDFFTNREYYLSLAEKTVYCGPIDQYFDYNYGPLKYRSLRFETEVLPIESYQGNAAVNYTGHDKPFTRIIEHKYFEFGTQKWTVITKEYSQEWELGMEPYYPVNDESNQQLLKKYQALAEKQSNVFFCGRLAEYKYYDMHQIVEKALHFDI